MPINKRAQIAYYDFMIGIVIFSFAFGIFAYNYSTDSDQDNLEQEAKYVSEMVFGDSEEFRIVDDYRLNATRLAYIKTVQYQELKKSIDAKNNFYVYLDEPSNILFGEHGPDAKNIAKIERIIITDGKLAKAGVIVWD